MTTATITKPRSQAAINVDLFDSLPVGAFFQVLSKPSRRLIGRYTKVDAEHVQDIGDSRVWHFGAIEASRSHVTLYVEPWSVQ